MPDSSAEAPTLPDSEDPFLWMEEVEGERALEWVRGQNTRSLATLTSQDRYATNLAKAMDVAVANDRIPYGVIRDGQVYNFWQDEQHVRGLWRRTPLESYYSDTPEWETMLDLDALAATEQKNWVYKGVDCYRPKGASKTLCMLSLSDGGKDAVVQREFDLASKSFVADGFVTPEAKQSSVWVDANTLLISTDWGQDGSTLTESGYPSSARLWRRGTALDEAEEAFSIAKDQIYAVPWSLELADGEVVYGVAEAKTFYTRTYWLLNSGTPVALPLPDRAETQVLSGEYLLATLQQDWQTESGTFQSGDLVAFNLYEFLEADRAEHELVFRANERQAVNSVRAAKGTTLLSLNDNVASRLLRLSRGDAGWQTEDVALPGKGNAVIYFANDKNTTAFINYEGFLNPDTLLAYDTASGEMRTAKSMPAKFDSTGLTVSQHFATSKDGTQVPYFLVHREDLKLDGKTPTLLYGYGGFEVSMQPSYSALIGQLWLTEGGAYALANIRGGGEFGPAWHQAGLKQNRQRIYDDFIAIGEDLIERKVTQPRHLGIMGGSNGGLLMGVMLTQRPDLWNAAVVQVPLLDMLRYHKLLAGASWVGEYGDPDIPEERAFLRQISPYHNFDSEADYPEPFFVTSTKDDRVHPGHARKMAQLFQTAEKPFLYYENIDGGHSAAANQKARAERTALEFTYLADRLFAVE